MELEHLCRDQLASHPEQPAIYFGDAVLDWGWMRALADQFDKAANEAGLDLHTPVGVVARNTPQVAATLLALIRAGYPIVMIYAYQSPQAIARDIETLKLAAFVMHDGDLSDEGFAAADKAGTAIITLPSGTENSFPPIRAPKHSNAHAGPKLGPDGRPYIELLTSGTTGAPKRNQMSYDLIYRSMITESIVHGGLETVRSETGPMFAPYPFGNISGVYTYLPSVASGRPVRLVEKFTVKAWADLVKTFRLKHISLPSAGIKMVFDANVPPEDLASLRYVHSGAAPIDPAVQKAFETRYDCVILIGYGATEFGGPVSLFTAQLYEEFGPEKLGSVGRPWAGAEHRIVDPETFVPLPTNTEGLLELLVPRIGPDWIRTTDLALIDGDGFLYHRGRADGAIMRGGFKILPEAVASALRQHPAISEAVVIGLDDSRLGQVPVAMVEVQKGEAPPSNEDLVAYAKQHLYATHVPARILIVEEIPRTPSYKIKISDVKARFEADA